jgi:hypothetical protein
MASAVRKLTGVGGDIRKIARLLQKEAPPGHMLAYINQEEADLLKARGGSGKPHEDTGVPSFETDMEIYDQYDTGVPAYAGPDYSPGAAEPFDKQAYNRAAESGISAGESGPGQFVAPTSEVTADVQPNNADARFSVGSSYTGAQLDPTYTSGGFGLTAPPASAVQPVDAAGYAGTDRTLGTAKIPTTTGDKTPADDGFFSNMSDKTKARLGIGGAQAVLGAYQVSQATEQAKKYREDMAKLAQPYQAEGKKLIAQAQSGELTPAAQQQLQAAQAQAAQGAQARGGVGAQQAMMAVENMRQQLLQNQYDYGLKVSGIGDSIASGAIRTGMDADRYVNQLASSYASNVARTLSNAPTYVNSYSQIT